MNHLGFSLTSVAVRLLVGMFCSVVLSFIGWMIAWHSLQFVTFTQSTFLAVTLPCIGGLGGLGVALAWWSGERPKSVAITLSALTIGAAMLGSWIAFHLAMTKTEVTWLERGVVFPMLGAAIVGAHLVGIAGFAFSTLALRRGSGMRPIAIFTTIVVALAIITATLAHILIQRPMLHAVATIVEEIPALEVYADEEGISRLGTTTFDEVLIGGITTKRIYVKNIGNSSVTPMANCEDMPITEVSLDGDTLVAPIGTCWGYGEPIEPGSMESLDVKVSIKNDLNVAQWQNTLINFTLVVAAEPVSGKDGTFPP